MNKSNHNLTQYLSHIIDKSKLKRNLVICPICQIQIEFLASQSLVTYSCLCRSVFHSECINQHSEHSEKCPTCNSKQTLNSNTFLIWSSNQKLDWSLKKTINADDIYQILSRRIFSQSSMTMLLRQLIQLNQEFFHLTHDTKWEVLSMKYVMPLFNLPEITPLNVDTFKLLYQVKSAIYSRGVVYPNKFQKQTIAHDYQSKIDRLLQIHPKVNLKSVFTHPNIILGGETLHHLLVSSRKIDYKSFIIYLCVNHQFESGFQHLFQVLNSPHLKYRLFVDNYLICLVFPETKLVIKIHLLNWTSLLNFMMKSSHYTHQQCCYHNGEIYGTYDGFNALKTKITTQCQSNNSQISQNICDETELLKIRQMGYHVLLSYDIKYQTQHITIIDQMTSQLRLKSQLHLRYWDFNGKNLPITNLIHFILRYWRESHNNSNRNIYSYNYIQTRTLCISRQDNLNLLLNFSNINQLIEILAKTPEICQMKSNADEDKLNNADYPHDMTFSDDDEIEEEIEDDSSDSESSYDWNADRERYQSTQEIRERLLRLQIAMTELELDQTIRRDDNEQITSELDNRQSRLSTSPSSTHLEISDLD